MGKTIRGAHADLRSVRAPASIRTLNIKGSRIESLDGTERFEGLDAILFWKARTDDLRPLVGLAPQLKTLRINDPVTTADFDSIFALSDLEELWINVFDAADAHRAAMGAFERLPRLKSLWLLSPEDFGIDLAASWIPQLRELERVFLDKLGIREEDTEAVCRAGPKLGLLRFRERSPAQTQRLTDALAPGVVELWEPSEPSHGVIFEINGRFSVTFGFPRAKTSLDQEIAAERLLKGKWSDLAPALEMDAGGDEVMFTTDRREVLEDLVQRATATKVV
jgi:hypothetical protein